METVVLKSVGTKTASPPDAPGQLGIPPVTEAELHRAFARSAPATDVPNVR